MSRRTARSVAPRAVDVERRAGPALQAILHDEGQGLDVVVVRVGEENGLDPGLSFQVEGP
jgi:hypothetical protein